MNSTFFLIDLFFFFQSLFSGESCIRPSYFLFITKSSQLIKRHCLEIRHGGKVRASHWYPRRLEPQNPCDHQSTWTPKACKFPVSSRTFGHSKFTAPIIPILPHQIHFKWLLWQGMVEKREKHQVPLKPSGALRCHDSNDPWES